MSQAVNASLQAGREALRRHAWREAFERLKAADQGGTLTPDDLAGLAEAAWWAGRLVDCIEARERAYAGYIREDSHTEAARMALAVASDHEDRLAASIAKAWGSRAERLLENEPESIAHGYLALARRAEAAGRGDREEALRHAQQAYEIGNRLRDRDLIALALHGQGRVLLAMGRAGEGMGLIDEATVAAVGGELNPFATGLIYCLTIACCANLADYRRAGDWTEAAHRWCEREAVAGFPGLCRIHRAEIVRLRGSWAEAEQEARKACAELQDFGLIAGAGEGFYEIGEIRLRMGDFSAAEDAFRQAHELGCDPQPGLSLLRLKEGKVEAAASSIKRALSATSNPLARARLLPAEVEVAIAAGDLSAADAAAAELEGIARTYATPALEAKAAYARGAVKLAEGNAGEAIPSLRRSWLLWQEVDAPYEAAAARMLLGVAYREDGDREAASLELQAAQSTFERLGAVPDMRRAADLLGKEGAAITRREPAARMTRTFMFSDIVKSTALVEAIGDEAWVDVVRWHDETLRQLFAKHSGEEVDHAGDGFFVAFESAIAALECAVAIQRALAEHRKTHGFAPQVRIGLHTAEASRSGRTCKGKGVHMAARVGALAEGGEIIASEATLAAASGRFATANPRTVNLKGIAELTTVVTVEWH